jgi:hypothetical protein
MLVGSPARQKSCKADAPLAAFTNRQMAASRSTKESFRHAKIVPEVTLNW